MSHSPRAQWLRTVAHNSSSEPKGRQRVGSGSSNSGNSKNKDKDVMQPTTRMGTARQTTTNPQLDTTKCSPHTLAIIDQTRAATSLRTVRKCPHSRSPRPGSQPLSPPRRPRRRKRRRRGAIDWSNHRAKGARVMMAVRGNSTGNWAMRPRPCC